MRYIVMIEKSFDYQLPCYLFDTEEQAKNFIMKDFLRITKEYEPIVTIPIDNENHIATIRYIDGSYTKYYLTNTI